MNTEYFIKKAREIHGDKYDYSKVVYVNPKTTVDIVCPIHGLFPQLPYKHLSGHGCRECANKKRNESRMISTEEFIKRAKEVHGNKYDYSKVIVSNMNKNVVTIICPIHGEFEQTPSSHLSGKGCRKCGIESAHSKQRKTQEKFIEEAKKKHNNFYSYDNVKYVDKDTKVIATCPIHGDFEIIPDKHIHRGDGCPKCRYIKSAKAQSLNTERFIEKARKIHGDKYDYSKVEYVGYDEEATIICPTHGEFKQTPDSHLQGCGCQSCSHVISKGELELVNYIKSIVGEENVIQRERTILKPKELDIYIPSLNIAIEYNGLRWHSEEFGKDKNYHLNKTLTCKNQNVKLIHIFEDEYLTNKDLVLSKINYMLGYSYHLPKIMGRKCEIKEINTQTAKDFLNAFHIQQHVNSTVYIGAYNDNKLIGVMSFRREIKNSDAWELTRFATDFHYRYQGVGSKMLSYFINNYNPQHIKSFADRRWTLNENNNIYTKLGFTLTKILKPDYRYYNMKINPLKRIHKFNLRKEAIKKKYCISIEKTENELTKELGYSKIWDCGLFKYEWHKNP